jgi:two-component system sensor histidine kinase UhpB
MPLRTRLVILVGLVLLASLVCDTALVAWQAVGSVRTELRAALNVGSQTIRNGFDDLAHSNHARTDLRHLIATFNGNRHVRALLLDDQGRIIATSRLLPSTQPVPDWFRRLIASDPGAVRLAAPRVTGGDAMIVLQADPVNELGEVWRESRDGLLVLGGFALLSALSICAAVERALRPLVSISSTFARISKGDYHVRVPEHGPPELMRVAIGLNLMARRLATVAAQNRRLNERLLTLQAEERADLARNLHDEIGPLLFSVEIATATIERLIDHSCSADISTHARSIHDAVSRMQRHVRAILGRLRPLETIGLAAAVDQLVTFWRGLRPETDFTVSVAIEEDLIDDATKETVYRVIQEAVSNAIRHGAPARVEIAIARDAGDNVRVAVTDDGIGMPADETIGRAPTHFGLIGMRERVAEMAGSLAILRGPGGRGVALVACLPLHDSQLSRNQDVQE